LLVHDSNAPLFNRAISGEYPPGSTLKPFVAVAALEEGIITSSTTIESRGGIQAGNFFFGDWKTHGFNDVRQAIAVSNDVFFYSFGGGYENISGLGMEKMKQYENLFGFGFRTGVDLPGEEEGFIPDEQWKKDVLGERWYIGNSYHASIGQGFITATPIQIAVATSAIANGGTLYQPRIVSHIRSRDGEANAQHPNILRSNFISRETTQIIQEGMRMTVTEGTAQVLSEMPVAIAGKTGTAQYGAEEKTHGWFSSFAPYENPEIVMVILIEGQDDDGYHAVPVTKKVYEEYFKVE